MLNSSDFRARAAQELVEIRNEVQDLATDRDVYWKVREVIHNNFRLLTTSSPFFDMLNDAYAHATASRVRRLVDRDSATVSLRRLIEQLAHYPDLIAGKMSADDLKRDLAELDATCKKVKAYVDKFVAHHDKKSDVPVPTHRELNEAVDTLIAKFRKYYALINKADVDVVVKYEEEPLSIFRFPWIDAPTAPAGRHTLTTDIYRVVYDDSEIVDPITAAFNRFNASLFNNDLPETKIRWASSIENLRGPGAPVGLLALPDDPVTYPVPDRFQITVPHIFITQKIRNVAPLDEWVLLHEMCHFRVPNHGPEFIEELKRVLDLSQWAVLLGGY